MVAQSCCIRGSAISFKKWGKMYTLFVQTMLCFVVVREFAGVVKLDWRTEAELRVVKRSWIPWKYSEGVNPLAKVVIIGGGWSGCGSDNSEKSRCGSSHPGKNRSAAWFGQLV